MRQVTIEHKKTLATNSNQKTVSNSEEIEKILATKDRREGKGRVLAISRSVFRLQNTDTYYIESASIDNIYYYVKYNPDVFEWCCCPDNSTRHVKCKHLYAIEFAIRFGTLKDIGTLPVGSKRYGATTTAAETKSYEEDEYSF